MTIEEIKALAAAKIAGQGNQVDLGNALTAIIDGLADAIADAIADASPIVIEGEFEPDTFIPAEGQISFLEAVNALKSGKVIFAHGKSSQRYCSATAYEDGSDIFFYDPAAETGYFWAAE